MCGFSGLLSKSIVTESTMEAMGKAIDYRGPDSTGIQIETVGNHHIGLVHKRLSIIDLSEVANQPMYNHDKSVVIVFNGEIYNYQELKDEFLKEAKYPFQSNSDTEVLLALYGSYGIDFVHHLNGMFAFALLDKVKGKMFFVRDRVGVKPLYYGWNEGNFYFGSELKTFFGHPEFKPVLNPRAIKDFMQFGYVPGHLCIYKGIHKISPGHYLELNLNGFETNDTEYWHFKENALSELKKHAIHDESKGVKTFNQLFDSAFNYRMIADVPVGVFLSGGYDSTLLVGKLSEKREDLKTFTIGFQDKKIDESDDAKKIAAHFGTTHSSRVCAIEDALRYLQDIPFLFDEPFGDPSAIPTMMVSELASEKVKVVLSADGGDEIFGGYDKHKWALKIHKMSNSPLRLIYILGCEVALLMPDSVAEKLVGKRNPLGRIRKIKSLLKQKDIVDILRGISKYISDEEINKWVHIEGDEPGRFKNVLRSGNPLADMLFTDVRTHLPDQIMTKVDRSTMWFSIEGREPLLDYRIIEESFALSNHLKINEQTGKYLLKRIVWDLIDKKQIDKPKQGFVVPLAEWLRGPLKATLMDVINEEKLDSAYFNVPEIIHYRDRFLAGENLSERKLWHLYIFQTWKEKWLS
ncbi:MAG: asparagine synthase (glutamine-hydrolyzing) [Bacteroidetes bacterium]|nr:asparagine synthase (glutamine-hydrolyzing) [Bacteroidota bacterium]